MLKRVGNMLVLGVTPSGVASIKCHCGVGFTASPPLADGNISSADDGMIYGRDEKPIVCTGCGCIWKINADLPPLPTEWKFFALWLDTGQGDDILSCLGTDLGLLSFSMSALPKIIDAHNISGYSIKEVDEREYRRLLSTVDQYRRDKLLSKLFDLF